LSWNSLKVISFHPPINLHPILEDPAYIPTSTGGNTKEEDDNK